MPNSPDAIEDLTIYPGGTLVMKGLGDLRQGELSIESLLVLTAAPRLTELGFNVPPITNAPYPAKHALYDAIVKVHPESAHYEFNALIQKIVSFANSYEQPSIS